MSGNVTTTLTANTTGYTAAMAGAAAATAQYAAAARGHFTDAAQSLVQLRTAQDAITAQIQSLRATGTQAYGALAQSIAEATTAQNAFRNSVDQAVNAGNSLSQIGISARFAGRELHSLTDEMASGRWSQFDGTLANILGTIAQTNPAVAAYIAGIAALGGAAGYVGMQFVGQQKAIIDADNASVVAGTSSTRTSQELLAAQTRLHAAYGVSNSDLNLLMVAMAGVSGPAQQFRGQLEETVVALSSLKGQDFKTQLEEVTKAANQGAAGMESWANKIHLLETVPGLQAQVKTMVEAHKETEAISAIMDALLKRFVAFGMQKTAYEASIKDILLIQAASGGAGGGELMGMIQPKPQKQDQGGYQESVANREATQSLNKVIEERLKLQLLVDGALKDEKAAFASGDQAAMADAKDAVASGVRQLAQLHGEREKEAHDQYINQLTQEIAANRDYVSVVSALHQKLAEEQKRYYTENSSEYRSALGQQAEAERRNTQEGLNSRLRALDADIAASRDNLGTVLGLEQKKLDAMRGFYTQVTPAIEQQQTRIAEAARRASDQEVQFAVDVLRRKQDLAGQDYSAKVAIEDQILSMLRAHYDEHTSVIQSELNRQAELTARAAESKNEIELRRIMDEEKANDRALVTLTSKLNQEVALHQKTKAQETALLQQFVIVHDQAVAHELQTLLSVLPQHTAEWQRVTDAIVNLNEKMNEKLQQISTKATADQQRAAAATQRIWERAFDSIGSAFSSTVGGLITGQETFLQAAQHVSRSILDNALSVAEHYLGSWIATYLGQELASDATNKAIVASQAAGQTGLTTLILNALGIRTAADDATNTQKTITTSLENAHAVESYAAVGGAAATASTAAIPIVGPGLAPEAGAAMYAEIQSYVPLTSLDVGAWRVPRDMVAQIHQGEMVVPETFAEGMRGGGSTNIGGSSLSFAPTINSGSSGGLTANQISTIMNQTAQSMYAYIYNISRNGSLMLPGRGLTK